MKRILISIVLLFVMGAMTLSCQKDDDLTQTTSAVGTTEVRMIHYVVDGRSFTVSLVGQQAWHDFLQTLVSLAEMGHQVSFRNAEVVSGVVSSKDKETFSTSSKEDAMAWSDRMTGVGYKVSIEYDKENGIYICTASH